MLNRHRDFRRKNKATLAVQGSIYSMINKAAIENIKITINAINGNVISEDTKHLLIKSINLALESNERSIDSMLLAQQEMNARTCKEYAHQQYAAVTRSIMYDENVRLVESVSDYIVTDHMISMTRSIIGGEGDQSGKLYKYTFIIILIYVCIMYV